MVPPAPASAAPSASAADPSIRVLVVEDDGVLAGAVVETVRRMGLQATHAADGLAAADLLAQHAFDLVLLDIGLPGIDGLRLLEQVRDEPDGPPVILLTARDALGDRVAGLDGGADDYLVKPVAMDELAARIRARLRGARLTSSDVIQVGALRLDTRGRRASVAGVPVELGGREWALLEYLARRVDQIVPKERLQQHLTGDGESNYNAVEVYVSRLRARLEPAGPSIRTVRGIGYLLQSPPPGATAR